MVVVFLFIVIGSLFAALGLAAARWGLDTLEWTIGIHRSRADRSPPRQPVARRPRADGFLGPATSSPNVLAHRGQGCAEDDVAGFAAWTAHEGEIRREPAFESRAGEPVHQAGGMHGRS